MISVTKLISILFFFVFFNTASIGIENKILFKINNEIITSVDIYNEIKYLKILNPNINNLKENQIYEISQESLIREKIKKIELNKGKNKLKNNNSFNNELINNILRQLRIKNEDELDEFLKVNDLSKKYLTEKIKIETLWNQLIVKKYINKVKIDQKKIGEEIKKNNFQNEYLLSEIIFELKKNEILNDKYKIIKNEIKNKGFGNAAMMFSISGTSKEEGKLGWIKENSLNKKIKNQILKIDIGEITNPILITGGYLILKIDDIKKIKKNNNFDDELKYIINKKTNEQLNQFSIIYFNKIKKNITINEL